MREILFRGLTTPKNKGHEFDSVWVEGDLITFSGRCFIHPKNNIVRVESDLGKLIIMHEVIPETVGQYTGLTDKNGKKIFEGDIVRLYGGEEYEWVARVGMEKGCWVVLSKYEWDSLETNTKVCEIIGNIHDNRELLKGAD